MPSKSALKEAASIHATRAQNKSDPSVEPREFHQGGREHSALREHGDRLPTELGPIVEGFTMSELRFALQRVRGQRLQLVVPLRKQKGGSTLPGGQPLSKSEAIVTLRLIFDYAGAGQLALVRIQPGSLPNQRPILLRGLRGEVRVEVVDVANPSTIKQYKGRTSGVVGAA